jgi:hypothetical protein
MHSEAQSTHDHAPSSAESILPHGMKRIDQKLLRPGDILLTTSDALSSQLIRSGTRSDISHAMIYVQGHSVIDATVREGVQARNTQRLFYPENCAVHALRLRACGGILDVEAAINFARSVVGTEYSIPEAIKTAFPRIKRATRKQFCSRLVAQAYAAGGIQLVANPDFCSPGDLLNSSLLENLGNVTIKASGEELVTWAAHPDQTQRMRDAIAAVLKGARKQSKAIQSLNDIDDYLIAHPKEDAAFAEIFRKSGYLDIWRDEQEHHPWRYEIELLSQIVVEEAKIVEYCREMLEDQQMRPNRFQINCDGYRAYYQTTRLGTFRLLHDLYENVSRQHANRVLVAAQWLALSETGTIKIEPHSKAWFAVLAARDPLQAQHVDNVLKLAGGIDVCSICGDDPAYDYILLDPSLPRAAITIRLCDDCLEVRAGHGETLVPFAAF